jgi:hypothetical protein
MTMKLWFTFVASFIVFQATAKAETIYTTVFNVFESKKTEKLLVLSAVDGRIYKTFKNDANLKRMKSLVGQVVRLDYYISGEEAVIANINAARAGEIDTRTADLNNFRYNQLRVVAPTDLQSKEEADTLFKNMLNDGDKRRSECFKRAHIWSYDMWSKLGINSEKIFIFWTKRFSILEDHDWWFHVAPMVTANGEELVMDGTFFEKPTPVKEWINYFMKTDKITCPIANSYQEYENNQNKRLCYIFKTPMHYFRPFDIEDRDKKGIERNHWVLEELQDARRSFKNWETIYEGLDNGKKTIKH